MPVQQLIQLITFSARPARGGHQPAHGLADDVVAAASGVGAVVAESRNGCVDDPGVDLPEFIVSQPELVHHSGAVVLYDHVALADEVAEHFFSFFGLQVQGDPGFVPVQVHEVGALAVYERRVPARIVAGSGTFYLYNFSAHICQYHAAVRPRKHPGKIEDANTVKQSFAHSDRLLS